MAAAFSVAQTPPASDAGVTPAPAAETAPAPPSVDIALVLPLDAPAYARAADAVRAGFLAAAEAAGGGLRTKVYAHGDDGVLPAVEAARAAGAKVIVGPLVRDDVKVVAAMATDLPYTIALNQLDEGTAAVPRFYTFALSIESDARVLARRLIVESAQAGGAAAQAAPAPGVVVISTDTPLLRRFATAFAAEWTMAGGSAPGAYRFDAKPEAMTAMRREIMRKPPGAVLLALDGAGAALMKPYLGTLPAYASALVFERETLAVARDLDGLVLVEIPWIVDPGAPQFAAFPKREFPSAALTRLYALGLDAFRVAQAFTEGAPGNFTLEGATGQVTLVDGHQFAREGRLAVFRTGQLTPLDAAR
jgi:uncharacterized protein